jgi:serine/threonine protein kinase
MAFAENGRPVTPAGLLGKGGQGEVYATTSHPGKVFKKYSLATLAKDPALQRRLAAMIVASPPERIERSSGHMLLAWPEQIVTEAQRLAGFLMPQVDMANTVELHRVTNPSDRASTTGSNGWIAGFTWQYLVRASANLAHATQVLHDAGVVIGDFNLKNIRVSKQALVTLIDCDSMQITDPASGERYFCSVVMPEFLPPELVGASLHKTVRHPSGDLYALAIHLYQLLLQGEHPFRGVWKGAGEKPQIPDLARDGMWALRSGGSLIPRPSAIEAGILPANVLELFRRAFEDGASDPGKRPSAAQWRDALNDLGNQLVQCPRNVGHWYVQTLSACPWCRHIGSRTNQIPLPPIQPMPPLQPPPPVLPSWRPTYVAPPRRRFRPGRLIAAGLGLAAVVICGASAIAQQLAGSSGGTTTGGTTTGGGGSQSTVNGDAGDTGTGSGSDVQNPDDNADLGTQAAAVRDLLSSSGAARRRIQPAIADVSSCGDLSADAAVFQAAAGNRSSHRSQADALDYSALPNGDDLHQSLVNALTASYQADSAYQDWATSLDGNCTRQAARSSSHLTDATNYSKTANGYKKTFVGLWNPICESYGWTTLQDTDI